MSRAVAILVVLLVPNILFGGQEAPVPGEITKLVKSLETGPEDPKASYTVGRFFLLSGDWDRALRYLAKGSDEFLRALIARELSGGDKVALGDSWWTGSLEFEAHLLTGASATAKVELRKEASTLRPRLRERALYWYAQAWPSADEAARAEIRKRAASVLRPGTCGGYPTSVTDMPGTKSARGSGRDTTRSWTGNSSLRVAPGAWLRIGPFPCAAGAKVEIACRSWSEGGEDGKSQILVRYFSSKGGLTHGGPAVPGDLPFWTRLEHTQIAPDGTASIDVSIPSESKTGAFWIDDLSVKVDGKELLQNGGFEK